MPFGLLIAPEDCPCSITRVETENILEINAVWLASTRTLRTLKV